MGWNEEFVTRWKKIVNSDAEFTKRNDAAFLNGNAPEVDKELFRKCKEVAQPYIDKMNTDPLSDHHALHAEMSAKINTITWEYTLRQDALRK